MAKGIRFYESGGPEVMQWESLEVGEPGPREVRVRHAAVGLNFADTYFRSGLYPAALPAGMGVEAAGTIEAVGAGVTDFMEGDRVTYTGSPLGAYSTERVMSADHLIKLPESIPFDTGAAITMRGLTSAYLLRRIAPLREGDTVLLHAAAGGVGLIFSQWASLLVCFGTASGPIPPINAMELAVKGSLFVTRPALADYIAAKDERAALADEAFGHVGAGRIHVEINQRYALEDAVQAHHDLESGRSIGSSVFELESGL